MISDPFDRLRRDLQEEEVDAPTLRGMLAVARFGEMAVMLKKITPAQLDAALKEQVRLEAAGQPLHIGQILLRQGLLKARDFVEIMAAQTDAEGKPTRILGKYLLGEQIGRGAMGIVYRGRMIALDRAVAVKMLAPGPHLSSQIIRRFEREAQAAARLRHPNIVGVHDVGQEAGLHYIVMDLIEGPTLDEWAADGSRKLRDRVQIVAKVARAMGHAHRQGVVHRDLKPGNIMIAAGDEPVIMDFGLARIEATDENLTQSGTQLGTPVYMAPEQVRGDVEKLDARTDVYALGVILYELACGHAPFTGASLPELYERILRDDPRPPSKTDRKVAHDLETIILHALQKEPDRRYLTATELADDLQHFLDGEPVAARRSSIVYRVRRRIARNPAAWTVAAVALVAIGATLAVWLKTSRSKADAEYALRLVQALGAVESRGQDLLQQAQRRGVDAATARRLQADFEKILADVETLYPGTAAPAAFRAWFAAALGDDEGARAAFDRAVADWPGDPAPLLLRARWRLRDFIRETDLPVLQCVFAERTQALTQSLPVESPRALRLAADALQDLDAAERTTVWPLIDPGAEYRRLAAGMRLFAARRFKEARAALESAARIREVRLDARMLLGMAHLYLLDYPAAADAWGQVVAELPASEWPWALARAGHVHVALAAAETFSDPACRRAVDLLTSATALDPSDGRAHATLAFGLLMWADDLFSRGEDPAGPLERAFKALDASGRNDPLARINYVRGLLLRARVAARGNADPRPDLLAAVDDMTSLIASQPKWGPAYSARGSAELSLAMMSPPPDDERRYRLAVEDFTAFVRLEPASPVAYANRATAHFQRAQSLKYMARWDQVRAPAVLALEDFSKALDLDASDPRAYMTRAAARTLAAEAAEKTEKLDPLEDYRASLRDLERARDALPDSREILSVYVNGLLRIANHPATPDSESLAGFARAVADNESLLARGGASDDFWVNAAAAYLYRLERFEAAGLVEDPGRDRARALQCLDEGVRLGSRRVNPLHARLTFCLSAAERAAPVGDQPVSALVKRARDDLKALETLSPSDKRLPSWRRRLAALDSASSDF